MNRHKSLSENQWIELVFFVGFLLGGFVRFFPGLQAGFPLNDGGMFLSMVRDLAVNEYALPKFTSYNLLDIPFAYPPFGFYIARLLADIFSLPELTLLRWLPPFVNSLSIVAFYLLASELLESKPRGALASAFYALTPGAFGWFVMGGGLTRSFGSFFLLLTVYSVLGLYKNGGKKFTALTMLFGALTVLSHPEAGIHAAASCLLVWIFFGRAVRSFFQSVIVAVGVLLLSSPWWATVISHHGLEPFLSAMQTGSHGTPLLTALGSLITVEGIIPISTALRVIGLAWGAWKRRYFLLAWAFLPFLVEPRSAPSVSHYPMTLLAALAFAEAFPALVARLRKTTIDLEALYSSRGFNAALFAAFFLLFIDSGLYGFRLVGNSLRLQDREAMTWVDKSAAGDAVFLVWTGIKSPEIDPYVEWFPALANRRNLTTLQGYEWLLSDGFYDQYGELARLQQCASVDCIELWAERMNWRYDYVAVFEGQNTDLDDLFAGELGYFEVYSRETVTIFERTTP